MFIGLGSNRGDRFSLLVEAVRRLAPNAIDVSLRSSPVYETTPIGPTGYQPFLNAVIEFRTTLPVDRLFAMMRTIETELGRLPPRSGPRTIDLDVLLFDDVIQHSDTLEIPHPRLHERDFVLRPLADLAPNVVHPVLKRSIRDLLGDIRGESCIIGVFAPGIPGPDEQ